MIPSLGIPDFRSQFRAAVITWPVLTISDQNLAHLIGTQVFFPFVDYPEFVAIRQSPHGIGFFVKIKVYSDYPTNLHKSIVEMKAVSAEPISHASLDLQRQSSSSVQENLQTGQIGGAKTRTVSQLG